MSDAVEVVPFGTLSEPDASADETWR